MVTVTGSLDERYRVYHVLSRVLAVGIIASVGLMVFGFGLLLVEGGETIQRLPPLGQLLTGVAALDPSSVIWFATLILILTPIARVVTAIVLFSLERDRRYSIITISVLLLLILSFIIGISTG